MTALEQIMQMKKQGRSEGEIIAALKSQGIPPMQISEAMNQSKIKEAVYDSNPTEGMTPSIMQSAQEETPQNNQEQLPQETNQDYYSPTPENPQNNMAQTYSPQTPQNYSPQYPTEQYQQNYVPQYQQNYYPEEYNQQPTENQEYYADQSYYGAQSTDTMIEVAEQVFSEKVKKMSEELKKLNEFKTIFETKVENLKNRLERMEKYFDKMQLEILNKVGEYGQGLNYMKKELKMVEDSMSKFSEKK